MPKYDITLVSHSTLDGKIRFSPRFNDALLTSTNIPPEYRRKLRDELVSMLMDKKTALLTTAETIMSQGIETWVSMLQEAENPDLYILSYDMEISPAEFKALAKASNGLTIITNRWSDAMEECASMESISYITLDSDDAFFGTDDSQDELEQDDEEVEGPIDYTAILDAIYQSSHKDVVVYSQSEFTNSDILHMTSQEITLLLQIVPVLTCDDRVPCVFSGEQTADERGHIAPLFASYKGISVPMSQPSPVIVLTYKVPMQMEGDTNNEV